MATRSATALLQLPVLLHGIRLGQPVDLLLAAESWRALGFIVLCGDGNERFLAFSTGDPGADEIAVRSALLLLEDVGFYAARSRSLRALLGRPVARPGGKAGELVDVLLGAGGTVASLVVAEGGGVHEVEPAAASFEPDPVSAA